MLSFIRVAMAMVSLHSDRKTQRQRVRKRQLNGNFFAVTKVCRTGLLNVSIARLEVRDYMLS